MPIRVGCLGGGQLGRMLALAGYPLGLRFTFLDPGEDSSAGQVAQQLVGDYDDPLLLQRLGETSDLVTFEFESVPEASATLLEARGPVFPPPIALRVGQDRVLEKQLFARLGIASASYAVVGGAEDLPGAWTAVASASRLKSRRLGYDGHGQFRVTEPRELERGWAEIGGVAAILEQEVPFDRELSIIGVRSGEGDTTFYPLTENHHLDAVLRCSLAPAPDSAGLQGQAELICARLMDALDYRGVLAVELFQVGEELLANEIAPRVHNSGHWTQDGAVTSQFESHLRAGLGWPMGSTQALGKSVMINVLGRLPDPAGLLAIPGVHLHLYGKAERPGRKLGHLNVVGDDGSQVTSSALEAASFMGVKLPTPRYGDSFWPN